MRVFVFIWERSSAFRLPSSVFTPRFAALFQPACTLLPILHLVAESIWQCIQGAYLRLALFVRGLCRFPAIGYTHNAAQLCRLLRCSGVLDALAVSPS